MACSVCGGSSSSNGGKVTLSFQRFFGECSDQYKGVTDLSKAHAECGIIQVLTNKWNAEHPNIQIQTDVVDGGTYYQKISSEIASGSPPDIALMHGVELPSFASRHTLLPLGDKLAKAGVDANDFLPAALNNASYGGKLYALPFDVHTILLHINMDLFKKAGLVDAQGNPKIPNSPDEFLAEARQMKERTGKQFVIAQSDADVGTDWSLSSFIWQQGGDVFSSDLKKSSINTPEGARALKLMTDLIKGGYFTPNVKDTNAMFLNGDVASIINGTWAVDQFDQQVKSGQAAFKNYRAAPFPNVFGNAAAWSNSHTWVIPARTNQDPAKVDAAIQFMKYLYDNNLTWARTGHFPARKSVLTSPDYTSLPHRSEYAQSAQIARGYPRIQQIDAFEATMREEMLGVYLGQKTPAQGLASAQQRVDAILNQGG